MATNSENGGKSFEYQRPPLRGKWETFQRAIYDQDTHQFLGRTGKNWGQLLLFYAIFYVVLAALFAICMQGLLATLDDRVPKWQLESSLIGTNPGLGFRPISDKTEEGSLIWYNVKNSTTSQKWIDLLDEFLKPYQENQTGKNFVACNFNRRPADMEVCSVDLNNFGNCGPKNSYGYNSSSPCVFLKLNRIIGWTPEYYDDSDLAKGDTGLDQEQLDKIQQLPVQERSQIWITCHGEGPADVENLKGFEYYPAGFPSYFFPYKNNENYLSPLIAIRVINPTPNVIVNIECRAVAKNINYRGGNLDRQGSVHFEVLVDEKISNGTAKS